jgi:dTDP-4-dehydrorhamnose 3,5-epimerase
VARIEPTELRHVRLVVPQRFSDERGFFSETWRADWGLLPDGQEFVQDNHAFSGAPNTIRGLHFQWGNSTQAKLLRVVTGAILDVAVDIRTGSPTYGQAVARELTAENGYQLFVPHGFAHGYQTLQPDTHVLYKVDRPYDRDREGAVLWSDPAIDIAWQDVGTAAAISAKDLAAAPLHQLDSPFVYDDAKPFCCRCLQR